MYIMGKKRTRRTKKHLKNRTRKMLKFMKKNKKKLKARRRKFRRSFRKRRGMVNLRFKTLKRGGVPASARDKGDKNNPFAKAAEKDLRKKAATEAAAAAVAKKKKAAQALRTKVAAEAAAAAKKKTAMKLRTQVAAEAAAAAKARQATQKAKKVNQQVKKVQKEAAVAPPPTKEQHEVKVQKALDAATTAYANVKQTQAKVKAAADKTALVKAQGAELTAELQKNKTAQVLKDATKTHQEAITKHKTAKSIVQAKPQDKKAIAAAN